MENRIHKCSWFACLLSIFEISLVSMHHFSQLMPVSNCCSVFRFNTPSDYWYTTSCPSQTLVQGYRALQLQNKLVSQTAKHHAHDIVNRTLVPAVDADMNQCMPKYGPALQNFRQQTTLFLALYSWYTLGVFVLAFFRFFCFGLQLFLQPFFWLTACEARVRALTCRVGSADSSNRAHEMACAVVSKPAAKKMPALAARVSTGMGPPSLWLTKRLRHAHSAVLLSGCGPLCWIAAASSSSFCRSTSSAT